MYAHVDQSGSANNVSLTPTYLYSSRYENVEEFIFRVQTSYFSTRSISFSPFRSRDRLRSTTKTKTRLQIEVGFRSGFVGIYSTEEGFSKISKELTFKTLPIIARVITSSFNVP